ncbi:MAG TPA: glycosyltransferase family A protein [Humisphaera sp.]
MVPTPMSDVVVSVIIPTYRHSRFVLSSLDSVLTQTFAAEAGAGAVEVIVVNDGSPDDTREVVRPLANAGRVRYVEQPNRGQSAARNRGLAMARGEFVAFLDDDDLWPADKLAWQVAALRGRPDAVACYGYGQTFGAPHRLARYPVGRGPDGDALVQFLRESWMLSPGQALFRAAAVRAVGGVDPAVWGADDWDLYLKLAAVGHFVYEDRLALHYRVHSGNASRRVWQHFCNARTVRFRHLRDAVDRGVPVRSVPPLSYIADSFRSLALEMARQASTRGDLLGALRCQVTAIAIDPARAARELAGAWLFRANASWAAVRRRAVRLLALRTLVGHAAPPGHGYEG